MDPITQGLLGAAAAQAAFGRRLGRSAALIGLAAGTAADLDVLIRSDTDPLLEVVYHRHFTHALAFIPIGGLLIGVLFAWWPMFRGRRGSVYGAAVIAYATHGLLDACTAYGTMLYWPLSDARVSWDVIAIIDPFFTGALLLGVVAAAIVRRVTPARVALGCAGLYLCFGFYQHSRVFDAQRQLAEARDHVIVRGRAMPTPLNLTLWRSVYLADDGRLYADGVRASIASPMTVAPGESARHATIEDLPESVRDRQEVRRAFERFDWFADGFLSHDVDDPRFFGDMRYAMPPESMTPIWGLRVPDGKTRTRAYMTGHGNRRDNAMDRTWAALWGRDPSYVPLSAVLMTIVPERSGD